MNPMQKFLGLSFFLVCIFFFVACVTEPTTVQKCLPVNSLENHVINAVLLITRPVGDGLELEKLDLWSGETERFEWPAPPEEALSLSGPYAPFEVKVSPSGEWIAYETYLTYQGYYIQSRNEKGAKFVRPQDYILAYTYGEAGESKWFLQEFEARSPRPTYYPFIPNETEKEQSHFFSEINPAWIANDWVAYSGTKQVNSLVVHSLNGGDTFYFPDWNDEWHILGEWFDAHTITLGKKSVVNLFDSTRWDVADNDQVILLDPFTGEKLVSGDTYPEMVLSGGVLKSWLSPTVYSPSRRYIAYLSGSDSKNQLVIWDRESNQPVAETPDGYVSAPPMWLSDTQLVYGYRSNDYVHEDELYLINMAGEISRLTSLSQYFKRPDVDFLSSRMSPNKRFLAFNIAYDNGEDDLQKRTLILDLYEIQTRDYCLFQYPEDLVWSPDGNYLAFAESQNNNDHVLIIDVAQEKAFSISVPPDSYPVGWISSETH